MPLTREPFDLVLPEAALSAARPLLLALADHRVRAGITGLGGHDLTDSGPVENLDPGGRSSKIVT